MNSNGLIHFNIPVGLLVWFLVVIAPLRAEPISIKVIVTADVHAAVFPFDFMNNEPMQGSLARVKTYVDHLRTQTNVILLDNGDMLQGQPSGYYYNFVATDQPHLIKETMHMMQYDAATLGNHDIETGPQVYNRLNDAFDFPWLAANIIHVKSGDPYFQPYTIIEREGVKIAVMGLATPSVPYWLPRKLWEGLEFASMYATAQKWMAHIMENENPDAVVGLFHSGAGPHLEYKGDDMYLENASRYVAQYVSGFDVVFAAHDHQLRNEKIINTSSGDEVLLLAGMPYGRSVAEVELVFHKNADGTTVMHNKIPSIVNTSELEPCEKLMQEFEESFDAVKDYINEPLGRMENKITSRESYFGNSAFTDFVHYMQREFTGAEISFAAPLSFDATIEEGTLKMYDMFKIYQFENYLYVMELSGQEIKDFLEFSYGRWFHTMTHEDDNLLLFRRDSEGEIIKNQEGIAHLQNAYFNFDSASGIIYTVDVSQTPGNRITISAMEDGSSFDLEKTYNVAINSYRGSGGGDHLTKGAGIEHEQLESRIKFVSDADLRSHMAAYIREKGQLAPEKDTNWTIYPVLWAEKASRRDHKILFGE